MSSIGQTWSIVPKIYQNLPTVVMNSTLTELLFFFSISAIMKIVWYNVYYPEKLNRYGSSHDGFMILRNISKVFAAEWSTKDSTSKKILIIRTKFIEDLDNSNYCKKSKKNHKKNKCAHQRG